MCELWFQTLTGVVYVVGFWIALFGSVRYRHVVHRCDFYRSLIMFVLVGVILGFQIVSSCSMVFVKIGAGLSACLLLLTCLDSVSLVHATGGA